LPPSGWHVEIIAALPMILSAESRIARSSAPIVIDHYGLPGDAGPESGPGRRFLELVALPHVWVKLSAPYRVSSDPLATEPPGHWLSALLQAAPERCLWGSDWPHTPAEREQLGAEQAACYRGLGYGRLLGDFLAAVADPQLRLATLRDNPRRLYGFSGM
jgi:predicted TIM-barrel fold metal-dependent hydrolase